MTRFWIAINPENRDDAAWFASEAEAFANWCDFGESYRHYEIEMDGRCRQMDDEFEERAADDAREARAWREHERSYARPW